MPLYREHEAAARAVLARHSAVIAANTIDYAGGHLSFSLDLAVVGEDAGLIEAVIVKDVENGVKP